MLYRSTHFLVIAAEIAAVGIIAAMILGLLPLAPAQVAWLIGVAMALAAAVVFGLPRVERVSLYGGLVLGACVFMLPFVWLVSTSMKQPEETFVFPPKWLPPVASAPRESPWRDPSGEEFHLALGDVRLRYQSGDETTIRPAWSATDAELIPERDDTRVGYHFDRNGNRPARFVASIPVAVNEQVEAVTVRMRQDASWHRLHAAVECRGQSYRDDDALFLSSRQWRELTFAVRPLDTDERAMGVWPMKVTSNAGAANAGTLELTLTIEPLGRTSATLAKWTQSYREAWYADSGWSRYLVNSVLLVALNVIGQVLACSMAAFALSRLHWPGRELTFGVILATMMLPGMILLIPQFLIFRKFGWYDTLLPLWVPAFAGTPFFIFMLRQFMIVIPKDLEEAARIDGCSWFGIYWRVMLPLMRPALAAVAIFTFMGTWNEFMGPLIYLSDPQLYPLPLGLYNFAIKNGNQFNMLMAASTLMTLPAVALFLGAQRYFIEGVTLTGMKG